MSHTVRTPPGPFSQVLSNTVYTVMARAGIHSVRDLGVPEHVRLQVLGLVPMTTEGLAVVAEALGVQPSDIVAEAQDDIDRHADCDHGGDDDTVEPVDENDADHEGEDLSGPYVIHHRPRVSLADLADELGIKQTSSHRAESREGGTASTPCVPSAVSPSERSAHPRTYNPSSSVHPGQGANRQAARSAT